MLTEANYSYCGEHFIMYVIEESLCGMPETNIYVSSTSMKKN